ncbi:MAG: hypothetical protein M5R36_16590 [Deltaproteobacteria bacterium]|nr:hypothetical protein [Deltaproteobacteria bacterium]
MSDHADRNPQDLSPAGHSAEPPFQLSPLLEGTLDIISRSGSRVRFLENFSRFLVDYLGCDAVALRIREINHYYRCRAVRNREVRFLYQTVPYTVAADGQRLPIAGEKPPFERLCRDVFLGQTKPGAGLVTARGSFYTGAETGDWPWMRQSEDGEDEHWSLTAYNSMALMRLKTPRQILGLIWVAHREPGRLNARVVDRLELAADIVASSLAHERTVAALRERVKELGCLYNIARAFSGRQGELADVLVPVAGMIAPAWRYPDIAASRIVVDGETFAPDGFGDGVSRMRAPLTVRGKDRGFVEVVYAEPRPERDEGPFLAEERALIDTLARQIGLALEEEESRREKERLHEQLLHADRLATVGKLTAGIAHEINEPLSAVLGFAGLVAKESALTDQGGATSSVFGRPPCMRARS